MSVRCAFPLDDLGTTCERIKQSWIVGMHPICPVHDRLPCPKCHKPVVDGHATNCRSCGADVRLGRRTP